MPSSLTNRVDARLAAAAGLAILLATAPLA